MPSELAQIGPRMERAARRKNKKEKLAAARAAGIDSDALSESFSSRGMGGFDQGSVSSYEEEDSQVSTALDSISSGMSGERESRKWWIKMDADGEIIEVPEVYMNTNTVMQPPGAPVTAGSRGRLYQL